MYDVYVRMMALCVCTCVYEMALVCVCTCVCEMALVCMTCMCVCERHSYVWHVYVRMRGALVCMTYVCEMALECAHVYVR